MADKKWTVNLDELEKDELLKLIDESDVETQKEFMQNLIQIYKIQKAKKETPLIIQDLDELEMLTRRINTIYLNVGQRIDNLIKGKDEEYRNIITEKEGLIKILQEDLDTSKNNNKGLRVNYNSLKEENEQMVIDHEDTKLALESKIGDLNLANNSIGELLDQYKEKVENQSTTIKEYEDKIEYLSNIESRYKELEVANQEKIVSLEKDMENRNINISDLNTKIENMMSELERLEDIEDNYKKLEIESKEQIKLLENTISDSNKTIKSLNEKVEYNKTEINNLKIGHEKVIQENNEKHKLDIESTIREMKIQNDETILKLKEEYQIKIQELHESYSNKIQSLLFNQNNDIEK